MLLAKDCILLPRTSPSQYNFALAAALFDTPILDAVLTALIDRRRRLLKLACELLPTESSERLLTNVNVVLDECTSNIIDVLNRATLAIPCALYSHSRSIGTVYHLESLTVEVANRFFDAGFREIDGYNDQGQTPLMMVDESWTDTGEEGNFRLWLLSKGASWSKKQMGRHRCLVHVERWSAVHFAAAKIGKYLRSWDVTKGSAHWDFDSTGYGNEAAKVDESKSPFAVLSDQCSCACSSSGCTVYSMILREFAKRDGMSLQESGKEIWWLRLVDKLVRPQWGSYQEVLTEVFRATIFNRLGLTHTCCKYYVHGNLFAMFADSDDAPIIQEEEAATISLLEDLLQLALSRWKSYAGPISDFISTFMDQEIGQERFDKSDGDSAREIENIGVKLGGSRQRTDRCPRCQYRVSQ